MEKKQHVLFLCTGNSARSQMARLTEAEQSLYDDLRENRLGDRVRLEQEKIRSETLVEALGKV